MPSYSPCRTDQDDDSHLYPSEDSGRSLCGKRVGAQDTSPDPGKPCVACGKRLLKNIFQSGGSGGIVTVEVTVSS